MFFVHVPNQPPIEFVSYGKAYDYAMSVKESSPLIFLNYNSEYKDSDVIRQVIAEHPNENNRELMERLNLLGMPTSTRTIGRRRLEMEKRPVRRAVGKVAKKAADVASGEDGKFGVDDLLAVGEVVAKVGGVDKAEAIIKIIKALGK